MISTLWSERIGGRGVIDCDFDQEARTIVAGDIDGSVSMLDAGGSPIGGQRLDMPIWGVAQRRGAHSHQIAVAGAEKERERGRAYLLADFERKDEFDAGGPLWDCAFTPSGACFTCWDSSIHTMDSDGKHTGRLETPGMPYGLAVDQGTVAVVLNEIGVAEMKTNGHGGDLTVVKRFASACYNVHSSRDADLVVTGTKAGSAAILSTVTQERTAGSRDVCAVAVEGEFLLTGSLDGTVALFHLGAFTKPLAVLQLPEGVWNIALDRTAGHAYAACGDGNLYCLEVEFGSLDAKQIGEIRSVLRSPLDMPSLAASASSPAAIEVALGTIEDEWDRWTDQDLSTVATICRHWLKDHASPRLHYVLGLAELERKHTDDAILEFQKVEGNTSYELKSLLPLGQALQRNGSIGAAIRVLRKNLPRVPEELRAQYLFEIGRLHERHGDEENALDVYELVSAIDHGYPELRESLERIRETQPPQAQSQIELSPDLVKPLAPNVRLSARRTDKYDELSYVLYEYGAPDEQAKKHLETDLMSKSIPGLANGGRSLDIGCATGRWPEWFARQGYESHGYDISPSSIKICRKRAAQHSQLSLAFEQHNISAGALLPDYFQVATCMMGTFNHVDPGARLSFLRGIRDSLVVGGHFVASVWNVSSPFCDFLGLDSQQAKEALRRNGMENEEVLEMLRHSRFEIHSVTPFCLLPNECYRVWEDEFRDGVTGLLEIEAHVRAQLTTLARSQMNFIVATAVTSA